MANLKARNGSGDPKSGFRAFLERVSSRFRRAKPNAGAAVAGQPVSISVTPAEPPSTPVNGLVIESVETMVSADPAGGGRAAGTEEDVNDDECIKEKPKHHWIYRLCSTCISFGKVSSKFYS